MHFKLLSEERPRDSGLLLGGHRRIHALTRISQRTPDMVHAVVRVAELAAADVGLSLTLIWQRRHPQPLRLHLGVIEDFEEALTGLVAHHLNESLAFRLIHGVAPRHEALHVVAIGAAALQFSMHTWVNSGLDEDGRIRTGEQMALILRGAP